MGLGGWVAMAMAFMGFLVSAQSYEFLVGGTAGWVSSPKEEYNDWAERNRFQINDTLVFKYKAGSDSVLLVSEQDYHSCKTSSPISSFKDGNTIFKFPGSGPFFFISGEKDHCQNGQKLIVVVLAERHNKHSISPLPSPSPKSSPSLAPSPASLAPTSHSPSPSLAPTSPSPKSSLSPSPSLAPTSPSPKSSPSWAPTSPSP
ncbi:hypothetical protein AMTRI_Chr01g134340 [Amborella trichopoda]